MKIIETEIPGVLVIEPDVFGDHRGWFCETWNRQKLHDAGIDADFVQDNQSYTKARGTLRGLHFQQNPMSQAKLVRGVRGAVPAAISRIVRTSRSAPMTARRSKSSPAVSNSPTGV